ncbi:hypothetical protein [Xanthobacter versatilis]|uniref:hypothetical protein n=1 Tax=Xanthobacter autotrophicus (strain ATCC BAA-1158 / Py2) TaxID=78245 RepID=UPI003727894F
MPKLKAKTSTSSEIADDLDNIRQEYQDEFQGFREATYHIMAEATRVVIRLRNSKKERERLSKQLESIEKPRLASSIMRFIMSAKSRSKKKLADKRARAMVHLYDDLNVDPSDFVEEIRAKGGIEKLARKSAQARKKVKHRAPTRSVPASTMGGKPKQGKAASLPRNISHAPKGPSANDNWPTVTLKIAPELSDGLLSVKAGARLRLIAVKKDDGYEVRKVTKLKKASAA